MKIAYRRMSGSVGLSEQEPGTRGAWVEKRLALFRLLQSRGHDVEIVGRLSKASGGAELPWQPPYDLLIVEFGGGNKLFNGAALELTKRCAQAHRGPKVFLCDDPDLDYLWDDDTEHTGWSIWNNSLTASWLPKQPSYIPVYDYPFSWNVPEREPLAQYDRNAFVYIGRPSGRARAVRSLVEANVPFVAYAKPAEWRDFETVQVGAPPAQSKRAGFYADSLACLALADAKHKKLAWRTGRAFHALAAGCPAVAEADHPGLAGFPVFASTEELVKLHTMWLDADARALAVRTTRRLVSARDAAIAEKTLREFGL